MPKKNWEVWESRVNERLGLNGTTASGATWKDKGDGSTRDNYNEVWPLMVDAKTTERGSFSVKAQFVEDMHKVAKQDGKTFAMPIKFLQEEHQPEWVVVPFEDYAYLVDEHRRKLGEFTVEEINFVRALGNKLKNPAFIEILNRVLAKMGIDR